MLTSARQRAVTVDIGTLQMRPPPTPDHRPLLSPSLSPPGLNLPPPLKTRARYSSDIPPSNQIDENKLISFDKDRTISESPTSITSNRWSEGSFDNQDEFPEVYQVKVTEHVEIPPNSNSNFLTTSPMLNLCLRELRRRSSGVPPLL
eukprot:GHVL01026044.1.p1 GENE.GHVL01026044.1~~GHVL01026044.1.p1  ORF type:complete len:166 (-),score=31.01 GHVL01026044.1:508-948(-)